jgi:hypothetical protein
MSIQTRNNSKVKGAVQPSRALTLMRRVRYLELHRVPAGPAPMLHFSASEVPVSSCPLRAGKVHFVEI